MVVILDYGMGNLKSVQNMIRKIGYESVISRDHDEILAADKLILPGVGAFDAAIHSIEAFHLSKIIKTYAVTRKKPLLGICLGMQLLASGSEEGVLPGLNLIPGKVVRFDFSGVSERLPIPHMGWNRVSVKNPHPLFSGFGDYLKFYFVHSYHFRTERGEDVIAESDYGFPFTCAVARDNISGVQFHPEKSHKYGMKLLQNFLEK